MNDIEKAIQNFGSDPKMAQDLNEFLKNKFEFLTTNIDQSLALLLKLNHSGEHSLAQLWLLSALTSNRRNLYTLISAQDSVQLLQTFFNNFVLKQINSQLFRFFNLVTLYSETLISEKKAIHGIKTLHILILKLQENNGQICGTLHKEFTRLCIKAKCYMHALPIVQQPITDFKKATNPMDILNYLYYRGIVFISQKQYQQAIDSFKAVISFPSQCTHRIHIESYKKLVILNLIAHYKMPDLPRYTSQMLRHNLDQGLQNYRNLANFFVNKDENQFYQLVEKTSEEFLKDKNLGLVKKLIKVYQRKRIQEMSDTYLTLRYTELKNAVHFLTDNGQVEQTLFEMITSDQIQAKIDSEKQMITFIDTASDSAGSHGIDEFKEQEYLEVIEELEVQNQRIIELMAQVKGVDTELQTSNQFIKRFLHGKGGSNYPDVSGGDF